jgi:hypothetical protein
VIDRTQIADPFSRFVTRLDINEGGYADLSATVTNSQIRVSGQKNISRGDAYLWVQNKLHNWHNVMGVENPVAITPQSGTVTLRMIPDTNYNAEWWNTYTGEITSRNTLQSNANGDITISVTNLNDDFALKITSAPAPPRNLRIVP